MHRDQQWQEAAPLLIPRPPQRLAFRHRLKIDSAHPQYSEAQPVKARYRQNLSEIRQRYRLEQAASQRLAS
ncbi:hypothetical protein BH23CYA1_BH23CYA1_00940 [soil metagenome]|uniref:hypothetical protein n=1 Tax=Leptolyngbya sp. BC1307 TaxID=2029589 RepID=UPI000EFB6F9A|nr:hypothetical protein [Leptolyngbya sp. BC1307]